MPLRAVFLDVGNTLLTERPSRFALYAEAASRRGRLVAADDMRRRMAAANRALPEVLQGAYRYSDPWFEAFIDRIFGSAPDGLGFDAGAVADITDELFARFEQADTFHVFDGAHALCRDLAEAGLTVGVISNWSARLPRVLEAVGLAPHLDPVLCSAAEGLEKPDSRLFLRAAARAGVAPAQALHAGDHPRLDVEAARRAGMRAVLVDHQGAGGYVEGAGRVTTLAALADTILERTR